jgi:predicted nucleic acid-binding protein
VILVDTSIWVDYFRAGDPTLTLLLNTGSVIVHPFVIGELSVGNLRDRELILHDLQKPTFSACAADSEVLAFISRHRLYGLGIGYIDCQLLAGIALTPGASLWTPVTSVLLMLPPAWVSPRSSQNAETERLVSSLDSTQLRGSQKSRHSPEWRTGSGR